MNCLACNESITWKHPVIYLGYDRAVHVSEFIKLMDDQPLLQWELTNIKEKIVPERIRGF